MGACVLCKEQITTPLSPQRLVEQMTQWLWENAPQHIPEFVKRSQELIEINEEPRDVCVITNTPMNVCAYCFTEHIYHWLTSVDTSMLGMYLTFFNYDVNGQGYIREARQQGYVQ